MYVQTQCWQSRYDSVSVCEALYNFTYKIIDKINLKIYDNSFRSFKIYRRFVRYIRKTRGFPLRNILQVIVLK